jgi:hypothetical protein
MNSASSSPCLCTNEGRDHMYAGLAESNGLELCEGATVAERGADRNMDRILEEIQPQGPISKYVG